MVGVGLLFGSERRYAVVQILVMRLYSAGVCAFSVLGYAFLWDGVENIGG